MIGAIIGDVVGSIYEFHNVKNKSISLIEPSMRPTDDTIMTVAVMDTLNHFKSINMSDLSPFKSLLIKNIKKWYKRYPKAGYGHLFRKWLEGNNNYEPYNSYGNGAAMRISPASYYAKSLLEAELLAVAISEITHNHVEGIKGAKAIAGATYLAKIGKNKNDIIDYITKNYYPNLLDIKYEELIRNYKFDSSCQGSVPQAIYCFIISTDFEDNLRTSISIGGDTDTICAMSSSIAEAYYQYIPKYIYEHVYNLLGNDIKKVIKTFNKKYCE